MDDVAAIGLVRLGDDVPSTELAGMIDVGADGLGLGLVLGLGPDGRRPSTGSGRI